MDQENITESIIQARKKAGLTQQELADKCNLNIRTVQRIESGKVTPRCYTIRILNEALNSAINYPGTEDETQEELYYRQQFQRRKKIRLATFVSAITLLSVTGIFLIISPSDVLFGMPKLKWAPIVYVLMFIHIIALAIYWRCPACNKILGDVFNIRRCGHCGLKFYD